MSATHADLIDGLPGILGTKVDVVPVVGGRIPASYVELEAFLTCKTVWGDPLWPTQGQVHAERLLRAGYERVVNAAHISSKLYKRLLPQVRELKVTS